MMQGADKYGVAEREQRDVFERTILPHLDAAYNLARWLNRSVEEAEDVLQDACLRACRYFNGYRGGDARSWLLRIVRNSSMDRLRRGRTGALEVPFDEEIHDKPGNAPDPGRTLVEAQSEQILREAIRELPAEFREIMILRELENLSYKEIADVAGVPVGTVMSRLARARKRLKELLTARIGKEL